MTAAFRGRQILLPLLFILLTAALFSCREKEEEKQYVYFDFQYEGRVDAVEITEGMKLSPPRCYREDYYVAYWTQENGRPIDKEEWKNITPSSADPFFRSHASNGAYTLWLPRSFLSCPLLLKLRFAQDQIRDAEDLVELRDRERKVF